MQPPSCERELEGDIHTNDGSSDYRCKQGDRPCDGPSCAQGGLRALARSATAIRVDHPKLEKVDGDARNHDTIEQALAGVEAVIHTLGVTPPRA